MADELRSCRRTGCRWPAAASLSYRYDSRQVWLVDLVEEAHPALYDLCPHHADHLTLPRGWHLVDQRTTPEVIVEPAAVDRVTQRVAGATVARHEVCPSSPSSAGAGAAVRYASEGSGALQAPRASSQAPSDASSKAHGSLGWTSSRYAALAADLPRLAASLADHPDLQPPAPGAGASAGSGVSAGETAATAATPVAGPEPDRRVGVTVVRARVATGEHGQIAGQLAIPVDELPPLGSPRGAVVVSIQRAGGRRRETRDAEL